MIELVDISAVRQRDVHRGDGWRCVKWPNCQRAQAMPRIASAGPTPRSIHPVVNECLSAPGMASHWAVSEQEPCYRVYPGYCARLRLDRGVAVVENIDSMTAGIVSTARGPLIASCMR